MVGMVRWIVWHLERTVGGCDAKHISNPDDGRYGRYLDKGCVPFGQRIQESAVVMCAVLKQGSDAVMGAIWSDAVMGDIWTIITSSS